jgi:hypothetical protein
MCSKVAVIFPHQFKTTWQGRSSVSHENIEVQPSFQFEKCFKNSKLNKKYWSYCSLIGLMLLFLTWNSLIVGLSQFFSFRVNVNQSQEIGR